MKDSTQIITNASGSIEPYKRPTVTLTSFLRKYHNNIEIPEGEKHHNPYQTTDQETNDSTVPT